MRRHPFRSQVADERGDFGAWFQLWIDGVKTKGESPLVSAQRVLNQLFDALRVKLQTSRGGVLYPRRKI